MAILGFELDEIERLIALMEERGLDEMLLEEEGRSLRLRSSSFRKPGRYSNYRPLPEAASAGSQRSAERLSPPPRQKAISAGKVSSLPAGAIELVAPMVGTFYRAERPGLPALIEIGQAVAVGQSIGLIEAMKVFNEVPSEHAGIVHSIPAVDGQLVQVGTPLVILVPA